MQSYNARYVSLNVKYEKTVTDYSYQYIEQNVMLIPKKNASNVHFYTIIGQTSGPDLKDVKRSIDSWSARFLA